MNIERLLELAAAIELIPHTYLANPFGRDTVPLKAFSMSVWRCDTIGCIGGWTNYLYPPADGRSISREAASKLGLDEVTADQLFFPGMESGWNPQWEYADVTPAMAAMVIRNLVDTGTVDWSLCDLPVVHEAPPVIGTAENPF
jgi:hypothetical protein